MPRKEARIFTSIWQDEDFIILPPEAQRMYFLLLSQPELSLCGHLTLAENRWARSAAGMTKAKVRADMKVLADADPRPFIVVDYTTDEVLIRSFVRRDHVLLGPKLVKPLVAAARIVRSPALRAALRAELQAAQGEGLMCEAAKDPVDLLIKLLDTLSIGYPENRDRAKEKEVSVTEGSQQRGPDPGSDDDPDFAAFWSAFPRKIGKGQARVAWRTAAKRAGPAEIVTAAGKFAASVAGKDAQFIPHPATWLNGERWADQVQQMELEVPWWEER